tara:strand:+ start:5605 stop:6501 length:897 start_codon:yes stop_codon:yes gene_type:complete
MKINLIAPVKSNFPHGNECRIVNWLATEEGKKLGIDLTITDLRYSESYKNNLFKSYNATIVFKGEMLNPESIQVCSQPRVLYFPDDILQYPNYARLIKRVGHCYDIVYTFDGNAINAFKYLGCKEVKWMPSWTGQDMFFNNMNSVRDIDICFIGNFNEYRIKMMNTVKYHFKNRKLCFKQGVYGHAYSDLLNRSKIVINAAQGESGVSQRVFEAGACGAAVFTKYSDDLMDLFNEDEIIGWYDFDDLIKKLRYYFDNPHKINSLADRTYNCVMNNHLAQHRFKKMLKDIDEWKVKESV